VSVLVRAEMPIWDGDPRLTLERVISIAGAVEPGCYELFCGPLKLDGADGAPARVLLRKGGPV
jgi:kynurenine formamidase